MSTSVPAAVAALSEVPTVQQLTQQFAAAGRQLFAVGGCVRDALSSPTSPIASPDIDFTTDATPQEIIRILDPLGTIWDAGARFGTIGVAMADGAGGFDKIEVTTHRAESYETTSRKPTIELVTDIGADLARRDLTINAVALRLTPGPMALVDPFGGTQDLARRMLRTPSDPRRTLDEDPLRILRVVRFAARFEFAIDPALADACTEFASRLGIVARERRTDELRKILELGGRRCATAFELAESFGVSSYLLGGAKATPRLRAAVGHLDAGRLILAAVATAGLLTGEDGPGQLRACRLANDEVASATTIARMVVGGVLSTSDATVVRAAVRRAGVNVVADALSVADAFDLPHAEFAEALRAICASHPALESMPLPVDGNDALVLGLRGRAIGEALARVEEAFCANPDLSRGSALELLR